MKKNSKLSNVMQRVREAIEADRFIVTAHADLRQVQRSVTLANILHALKFGHHEKSKDQYSEEFADWTYAIRGFTTDRRDLRIAVAFDENGLLIVTVIVMNQGKR